MLTGLEEGLTVLCIGFSTVFIFLVILIISMHIMTVVVSWLNKVFPVAAPAAVAQKASKAISDDAEIAIAVACATLKQNHG